MADYKLTAALSKGRLADYAIELLKKCGLRFTNPEDSRKLVFCDDSGAYRFLFVKPADVPTYVEHGVADIGVVGLDTIMEEDKDIYEMLDLRFGACKICIAGYPNPKRTVTSPNLRVATKYTGIARKYFAARGENIEIIKLNGSVELGPVIGLSDVILDIVESGSTLRANGLTVLEEVCDVSARLVVNRVSLKTKADVIQPLIAQLTDLLKKQGEL